MTKTLYVSGKMYEANTVSITDAELESLLAAEQSDEDFWEELEDLHDRLMGDSEVNGFRVSGGILAFPQISRQIMMSKLNWRIGNAKVEIHTRVQV